MDVSNVRVLEMSGDEINANALRTLAQLNLQHLEQFIINVWEIKVNGALLSALESFRNSLRQLDLDFIEGVSRFVT